MSSPSHSQRSEVVSEDDWQEQLMRLFWGVVAPFTPTIVPVGTKPMSVPVAHSRAMAVVYHSQVHAVRVSLARVEAGLPNRRDYANGQIDLTEYNRRIISIIQDVTTELARVGAEVESVLSEMDERDRRY